MQPQGQTGGNGNPGICFLNVDLVLGFPTTYLWESKYAALNVKIWLETKSHKTIPQAALERLHTHGVSVEVDATKLGNNLKHNECQKKGLGMPPHILEGLLLLQPLSTGGRCLDFLFGCSSAGNGRPFDRLNVRG